MLPFERRIAVVPHRQKNERTCARSLPLLSIKTIQRRDSDIAAISSIEIREVGGGRAINVHGI